MADIFLSYVRSDKARVAEVVERLRADGFRIWWDDDIPPDAPWEATIEQELAAARVVVVCWSDGSVASDNVRSEARWAKSEGKLIQIFLDACKPPLFFGERQGVDLAGWRGEPTDPRYKRLANKLAEMTGEMPAVLGAIPITAPLQAAARRSRSPIIVGALVVALALAAAASWWFIGHRAAPRGNRIAVLPFEVLSSDPATAVLARSLGDQIVTALNSSEMPALSRADAATIRGTDNVARLKELDVALVFDGTVESDGKTLEIKVHVNDPFAHATLWTGSAMGPLADTAKLRSQLTRTVVSVLACSRRALRPNGLTDPASLGRYLRACDGFVNKDSGDPVANFEMLDNFRTVVKLSPGFAAAHSDLAKFDAYLVPLATPAEAAIMRKESAREADAALAIDPRSPDAYVAKALLLAPGHWAEREALLRKGVALDADWPHTNGFLAQLLEETGRVREGTGYAAHAAAADLQISWVAPGAVMQCASGRIDETINELKDRLTKTPDDEEFHYALAQCLVDGEKFAELRAVSGPPAPTTMIAVASKALESHSEADRTAARAFLLQKAATSPDAKIVVTEWLSQLGFIDDALKVAATSGPGYPIKGNTGFLFGQRTRAMRRDPRFMDLMAQRGELAFWRQTGRWPDFCADPTLPYRCR